MSIEFQENTEKIYKRIVPDSNYIECEGCHNGKHKCPMVHILYLKCPCNECLVKTSCTDYCESYLQAIKKEARDSDIFHLTKISHKGYNLQMNYKNNKTLFIRTELHRWKHRR